MSVRVCDSDIGSLKVALVETWDNFRRRKVFANLKCPKVGAKLFRSAKVGNAPQVVVSAY